MPNLVLKTYQLVDDTWKDIKKISTTRVHVVDVLPADVSNLLIFLKTPCYALPSELLHLRRIRKLSTTLQCLVGPHSCFNDNKRRLEKFSANLTHHLVEAPQLVPRVEAEAQHLNQTYWPVTYKRGLYHWKLQSAHNIIQTEKLFSSYVHLQTRLPCYNEIECAAHCSLWYKNTIVTSQTSSTSPFLNHAVLVAINDISDLLSRNDPNVLPETVTSDQYYCEGFDVIVSAEPCYMCSMALVHSRVRSVSIPLPKDFTYPSSTIYPLNESTSTIPISLVQSTSNGGLFSEFSVVFCQSLNHHFSVYFFAIK